MVCCLILRDSHIESTHVHIAELFLSHVEVKKEHDNETKTTIFYMSHIEKQTVWQAVLNLEMENIMVEYSLPYCLFFNMGHVKNSCLCFIIMKQRQLFFTCPILKNKQYGRLYSI